MKVKNLLLVVLVLTASFMSLFFTACKNVYEDVTISITTTGNLEDGVDLNYQYNEDGTYTLLGTNELSVKVAGLDSDMLPSISYSLTNTSLLSLSIEKSERFGEYKVKLNPYLDPKGNIIQGGKTTITFISDAGSKKASVNVRVNILLNNIKQTEKKASLFAIKGGEVELSSGLIEYVPSNTTYKGVTYSLPNEFKDIAEIREKDNKQYLFVSEKYSEENISITATTTNEGLKDSFNETITLAVLPGETGSDIKVVSQIDKDEDIKQVTLYNYSAGMSKTLYVEGAETYLYTVKYASKNNNIARVVNLTGDGSSTNAFLLEYNQEGTTQVEIEISFLEYNYKITKLINVECVLLPGAITVSKDGEDLENNVSNRVIYDNYSNGNGSEFVVSLGNSNVLTKNRRFVVLFNVIGGAGEKELNEIVKVSGITKYIDVTNLLDGVEIVAFSKTLKVEDVADNVLDTNSNFYLKALEINKEVEMLLVPYACIEAGEDILKETEMFKFTFKTAIGADGVELNEIENLSSNIYYIEKGATENLSFILYSTRAGKQVAPNTESAKLVFDTETDAEYLQTVNYDADTHSSQVVKITGLKITNNPILVRLVLDNGITSDAFMVYVYSTLTSDSVKVKPSTNMNNNSSLGSLLTPNDELQSVDIAQFGSLGLLYVYNQCEEYTVNDISYSIRNSSGAILTSRELVINSNVLTALSPIKNATVIISFKTYEFLSYGEVEESTVTKSFKVTVFEPIKALTAQKYNHQTEEYENINSFTLYYRDNPKNPETSFKVMDYYSYNVYHLADARVRINFDNISSDRFGNVKYKWSVSSLTNTKNGEILSLTNSDLRECNLLAYRNTNNIVGSDNEVTLTCSITQYNKIYNISVVVVVKDAEETTNLNLNKQNIYLEAGSDSLLSQEISYKLYKQTATNKNLDYIKLTGSDCVNVSLNSENNKILFEAKNGGTATYLIFATDSTLKSATATKQNSITKVGYALPSETDLEMRFLNKTATQIEEDLQKYLVEGLIYKIVKVKVADGLSEETAYEISSKNDFSKMQENGFDKWYVVTQDIDLGEFDPLCKTVEVGGGTETTYFSGGLTGEYNGKNSTLYFSQSLGDKHYYGLFNRTEYAKIKNINLNYNITGTINVYNYLYIGAIAGYAKQSELNAFENINVTINGEINLNYQAGYNGTVYIGGAVGVNDFVKTENSCLTNVSVENNLIINVREDYSNASLYVGGVGGANVGGVVTGNYTNKANVNSYTYVTGNLKVNAQNGNFNETNVGIGGVVGLNESNVHYHSVVVNGYYSEINIDANVSNVGGIVGLNCGSVTDSIFCGTLKGLNNVGGIVGLAETSIQAMCYDNLKLEYNVVELLKGASTDVIVGNNNVGGLIGKIGNNNVTWVYDNDGISNRYDSVGTESNKLGYLILASYVKAYSDTVKIVGTNTDDATNTVAGLVGFVATETTKTLTNPQGDKTIYLLSKANVCSASVKCVENGTAVKTFNNGGALTLTNCYNNTSDKNEVLGGTESGKIPTVTPSVTIGKLEDVSNYSDAVVLVYNGYTLGKISPSEVVVKIIPSTDQAIKEYELYNGVTVQVVGEAGSERFIIKILSNKSDVNFFIPLNQLLQITNGEALKDAVGDITNSIAFTHLKFTSLNHNAKIIVNGLYIVNEGNIEILVTSKYSDASGNIAFKTIYDMPYYKIVDASEIYPKVEIEIDAKDGKVEDSDAISISIKNNGSITLFEKLNEQYKVTKNFKIAIELVNGNETVYFTINGANINSATELIERALSYILKIVDKPTEKIYMIYHALLEEENIALTDKSVIELNIYTGADSVEVEDADEIRINATSTSVINVDVKTDNIGQKLELQVDVNGTLATFDTGLSNTFVATAGMSKNAEVKVDGKTLFNLNYLTAKMGDVVRFIFTITPRVADETLTAKLLFVADDYKDIVTVISEPVEVTNIAVNHFTSFQHSLNKEEYIFNVNENTSNELGPGEMGLLVADVYPQEAIFDEIQIEYFTNDASLTFIQLAQSVDNAPTGNISLTSAYKIVYPTATVLPSGNGLSLNKISTVDNDDNYNFNGKLYIGVLCNSSARLDQNVRVVITSVRYNLDGSVAYTKVATKMLLIKAQTVVDIDVENKVEVNINNVNYILAPVGTELILNINIINSTGKAELDIGYLDTFNKYRDLKTAYKPWLKDNKVVVDYLCDIGKRFYVTATIIENINGTYKEYTKVLYFITTEFTVNHVYIDDFSVEEVNYVKENDLIQAIGNVKVLQGIRYEILAKVNANRGTLSSSNHLYNMAKNLVDRLEELRLMGQEYDTALYSENIKLVNYMKERYKLISASIKNFEYEISNSQTVVPNENTGDNNSIWLAKTTADNQIFNIKAGKKVGTVQFGSSVNNGLNIYTYMGVKTGSDVSIILNFGYGLLNGKPSIFATNGASGNMVDFTGNITTISSNTQETPTPIFTKEDLYNIYNDPDRVNKHYILMSNLDLTSGFVPLVADFASLDGNGYTVAITNLQLSEGQTNLGFFTEIYEGTVIKNLYVMYRNANSKSYTMKVDLSTSSSSVNFGLFAGVNNGVINNCMVVPFVEKGEVHTVNIDIKTYNNTPVNFGGFVAENNGEILYSNISNNEIVYDLKSSIQTCLVVRNNGATAVINKSECTATDTLIKEFTIVPLEEVVQFQSNTPAFNVIGEGLFAGFVKTNTSSGNIVACYARNVGIYNLYTSITNSQTAGFVAQNAGSIHECFVEGTIDDETGLPIFSENLSMSLTTQNGKTVNIYILPYLYSVANIGGFVYQNELSGKIHNSYSSINLFTNARSSGFVFVNSGEILNCYTNSVNSEEENSSAHTYFTGTNSLGEVNNSGIIEYCYYYSSKNIIVDEENYTDPASQIIKKTASEFGNFDINDATGENLRSIDESVWSFEVYGFPETAGETEPFGRPILRSTNKNTVTEKQLQKFDYVNQTITTYYFDDATVGKVNKNNPILVSTAEEFMNAIFEKGSTNLPKQFSEELKKEVEEGIKIKSYIDNVETLTTNYYNGYIRIIADLNFNLGLEEITDPLYTKKRAMLSKIVFAGVIDGAYHTITGLTLTSSNEDSGSSSEISNNAFGMFAQVGISTKLPIVIEDNTKKYVENKAFDGLNPEDSKLPVTIIKNLGLEVDSQNESQEVGNRNAKAVGVLAGEAVNAALININVNGNGINLLGYNYVGGLVGRLSEQSRAQNITVSNVNITAIRVNKEAAANKAYDYSDWCLIEEQEFDSDVNAAKIYTSKYAFEKIDNELKQDTNEEFNEYDLDSKTGVTTSYAGGAFGIVDLLVSEDGNSNINNIKVDGNIAISGEFAGGVSGFVGEGNIASQLVFVVNTTTNSQNIAGLFATGGLVAENRGEISTSTLEAIKEITLNIEENGIGSYPDSLFKAFIKNSRPSYSKFAGGIAGINYGSIVKSYTKAPVINSSCTYVGGIVGVNILTVYKAEVIGDNKSAAKLDQVYAVGNIDAKSTGNAGGIIGLYIINNEDNENEDDETVTSDEFNTDNLSNIVALNNFKTTKTNVGAVFGKIEIKDTTKSIKSCQYTYYNILKDYTNKDSQKLNYASKGLEKINFVSKNLNVATKETDATKRNLIDIIISEEKQNQALKQHVVFANFTVDDWDKDKYLYPRLVVNSKIVYKEIKTEEDLRDIDLNGRYVLVNDIYLTKEWKPLAFNGVLTSKAKPDGNYYSIYNINISKEGLNNTNLKYVGFFSTTSNATILNITFHIGGNKTNGTGYTAGHYTTGYNIGTTGNNFDNEVIGVGGLIGRAQGTYVSNCSVKFTQATDREQNNVITENASIKVGRRNIIFVGGFIAYAFTDNTLLNNKVEYVNIQLTSEEEELPLSDPADKSENTTFVGGFIGKSDNNSQEGYNTVKTVTINVNHTDEGNYQKDLFIGGVYGYVAINEADNLTFSKISNITINASNIQNDNLTAIGGFAGNVNCSIKNINVENVGITTSGIQSNTSNIGGFVGTTNYYNSETESLPKQEIRNCSVYSVSITEEGATSSKINIGGFVGYITGSNNQITYSASYGIINLLRSQGKLYNIGGFVGVNGATIQQSFSNVSISENTTDASAIRMGGFAGLNHDSSSINNCYSVGPAIVSDSTIYNLNIGGFVGQTNSSVTNSYTITSIYPNVSKLGDSNIGGFAGSGDFTKITECYYIYNLSLVPHNDSGVAVTRQELDSALTDPDFKTSEREESYYPYIEASAKVLKCLGYNSSTETFIEGTRFNPVQINKDYISKFNTNTHLKQGEMYSEFIEEKSDTKYYYTEYVLTSDITLTENITINGFVNANGYKITLNSGVTLSINTKTSNTITLKNTKIKTVEVKEVETTLSIPATFTGAVVNLCSGIVDDTSKTDDTENNTAFSENSGGTIFNTLVTTLKETTTGGTTTYNNNVYTKVNDSLISGFINTNNGVIINSSTNAKFDLAGSHTGNINGFVNENSGTIYNSYSTVEFTKINTANEKIVSGFVNTNSRNIKNSYTAMLYVCEETSSKQHYFTASTSGNFENCFADINSIPYAKETNSVKDLDFVKTGNIRIVETLIMQTKLANFNGKEGYLHNVAHSAWQCNEAFNYGYPILKDYCLNSDKNNHVVLLNKNSSHIINNIKLNFDDTTWHTDKALYTGNGTWTDKQTEGQDGYGIVNDYEKADFYQITHPGMLRALDNNGNDKLTTETAEGTIESTHYFIFKYDLDFYTYYSSGWAPVNLCYSQDEGKTYNPTTTTFDGNGKQTSNLNLIQANVVSANIAVGMFSTTGSITINTLVIPNVEFSVTGTAYHGGVLVANANSAIFKNVIVNCQSDVKSERFGALVGGVNSALTVTQCFVNLDCNITTNYFGYIAGVVRENSEHSITETTTLGDVKITTAKTKENSMLGGLVGNAKNNLRVTSCATLGNITLPTPEKTIYAGGFVGLQGNSLTLKNSYTILTIDNIDYSNSNILTGGFVGSGNVTEEETPTAFYDSSYTKTIAYKGNFDDYNGVGDKDETKYDTNANSDNKGISNSAISLNNNNLGGLKDPLDASKDLFKKDEKFGTLLIQNWLTEDSVLKLGDKTSGYGKYLSDIFKKWVAEGAKLNPVIIDLDGLNTFVTSPKSTTKYGIINADGISLDDSWRACNITEKTHLMGGGKTITYSGTYPFDEINGFIANITFNRSFSGSSNEFCGVAYSLGNGTLFKVSVNIISGENFNKVQGFGGLVGVATNGKTSKIIDCKTSAIWKAGGEEYATSKTITLGTSQITGTNGYDGIDTRTIQAGGILCNTAKNNNLTIAYTSNNINIKVNSIKAYAGGFIAVSNDGNTTITNCTNNGTISSEFLKVSTPKTLTNTDNPVVSYHYLGGFAGQINHHEVDSKTKVTFVNSQNLGSVDNRGTYHAYSGGFIGYMSIQNKNVSSFTNCYNGKEENKPVISTGSTTDYIRLSKEDYDAIEDGAQKSVGFYDAKTKSYLYDGASDFDSIASAGGFVGYLNLSVNLNESYVEKKFYHEGTENVKAIGCESITNNTLFGGDRDLLKDESGKVLQNGVYAIDKFTSTCKNYATVKTEKFTTYANNIYDDEYYWNNYGYKNTLASEYLGLYLIDTAEKFEITNYSWLEERLLGDVDHKVVKTKMQQSVFKSLNTSSVETELDLYGGKLTTNLHTIVINGYTYNFYTDPSDTYYYSVARYSDLADQNTFKEGYILEIVNLYTFIKIYQAEKDYDDSGYVNNLCWRWYNTGENFTSTLSNYKNQLDKAIKNILNPECEFNNISLPERLDIFNKYYISINKAEGGNLSFYTWGIPYSKIHKFDHAKKFAGGAIGFVEATKDFTINNFENNGDISAYGEENAYHKKYDGGKEIGYDNVYAGGVVGYVEANSVTFTSCTNNNKVESSVFATGIAYVQDECNSYSFGTKQNGFYDTICKNNSDATSNATVEDIIYQFKISNKNFWSVKINWPGVGKGSIEEKTDESLDILSSLLDEKQTGTYVIGTLFDINEIIFKNIKTGETINWTTEDGGVINYDAGTGEGYFYPHFVCDNKYFKLVGYRADRRIIIGSITFKDEFKSGQYEISIEFIK